MNINKISWGHSLLEKRNASDFDYSEQSSKIKRINRTVKVTFSNRISLDSMLKLADIYRDRHQSIEIFKQNRTLFRAPVPVFPLIPKEASDDLILKQISRGNLLQFKFLLDIRSDLKQNINLELGDEDYKRTCLVWAIKYKKLDIIKLLIEYKFAEIDIEDHLDAGETPAVMLSLDGNLDEESFKIAEYLISKGARIDELFNCPEINDGEVLCEEQALTAAGFYAIVGDLNRLKIIHKLGANLHADCENARNPLAIIIETLLDNENELADDGNRLCDTATYLISNGAGLGDEGQELLKMIQTTSRENDCVNQERATVLEKIYLALSEMLIKMPNK